MYKFAGVHELDSCASPSVAFLYESSLLKTVVRSSFIADNDKAAPTLIDCSLPFPLPIVKAVALTELK